MESKAVTFRLPLDTYEKLRREAFERRVPMNELVVEGIQLRLADPTMLESLAADFYQREGK